ncbi:MAG: cbb3-type cytochrome c oxidase subunit 3 [Betaproteobacteria bacterium]|nr:cbb3-type cytochrome c oxidase subunit 3 [Betaproteobacteria bacterium]
MDPVTGFRVGSTLLMLLIFAGIVWWAYGGRRGARFDVAAHSVLQDDDAPVSLRGDGREK